MLVLRRAEFLPRSCSAPSVHPGKSGWACAHQRGMTQQPSIHISRCLGPREPVDVTTWRRCRLLDAGFDRDLAERLAASRTVDLHALLQLVDRGCPPALAARIVAPLSDTEWPA